MGGDSKCYFVFSRISIIIIYYWKNKQSPKIALVVLVEKDTDQKSLKASQAKK